MRKLIYVIALVLMCSNSFAQFKVKTADEAIEEMRERRKKLIEAEKTFSFGTEIIHGQEFYKFDGGEIVVEDTILDGVYHEPRHIRYRFCYKAYDVEEQRYYEIIQNILNEAGDSKTGKQIKRWKMGYGWKHPVQTGNIGFQYVIEDKIMIIYEIKI